MKKLLFGGSETTVTVDLSLAMLRIFSGLAMAFGHGIRKLPPSEGFIERTAEMGFPFPTFFAYTAAYSEFLGGIFLALGFMTRPSAFFMAAILRSYLATTSFGASSVDPSAFLIMQTIRLAVLKGPTSIS